MGGAAVPSVRAPCSDQKVPTNVIPLPENTRRTALRAGRGAAALAGAAWVLIVIGALVRAHGAGLSCPDWPLCHGQVVPDFDARIALEWGHRLFAG